MKATKLQFFYSSIHVILFGIMIYVGFSFAAMENRLWADFWEVGWANYTGTDVDYPSNTFHTIFIMLFIGSLWSGWYVKPTAETKKTLKFWMGAKVLSLAFSIVAYLVDGDFNVRETTVIWVGICSLQMAFAVVWLRQISDNTDSLNINQTVWLVHTIAYIGLLGAGFYFWNWDNQIVAERRALGDAYEGVDKDLPENTYFLAMTIAGIVSVLIELLYKTKQKRLHQFFVGWAVVIFATGFFLYANDGNPDMGETAWAWISICIIMIVLSAILYKKAPNQPITSTDLLDSELILTNTAKDETEEPT